jgi:hypothetical protein
MSISLISIVIDDKAFTSLPEGSHENGSQIAMLYCPIGLINAATSASGLFIAFVRGDDPSSQF